jgi:uncharacterized protein (DUF302 family)
MIYYKWAYKGLPVEVKIDDSILSEDVISGLEDTLAKSGFDLFMKRRV